jgi:predicted DNA-binding transcriptional regulator AlpA
MPTTPTTPYLLRFRDLKDRGLVDSWATLSKWIRDLGFPRGILVGPNTRVWTDGEVAEWLASRPTAPKPVSITESHVSRRLRRKEVPAAE